MRTLALALVVSLAVHPALLSADQHPIADAVAREARRVALIPAVAESQPAPGWSRVMRLPGGIDVSVMTTGGSAVTRTTVAATPDMLFLLNLEHSSLSRALRETLREAAEKDTTLLVRAATDGTRLVFEAGTLGPEGVVIRGRKVAELADVLVAISARDVRLVERSRREGKARGVGAAVLGGIGGAFGGAMIGSLFTRNCACDDPGLEGALYGFWIGIPAGAAVAYRLATRPARETIYRQ